MNSSSAIRSAYTSEYYLTDCGGYQEYLQYRGRRLADERLIAVASAASLRNFGRVLDLGCGRGELAYYLAANGHPVTAIDYSADSIRLAMQTLSGSELLSKRVELVCNDVTTIRLRGEFELAIAADLIEHLSPPELDQLYKKVSRQLSPTGLFIVHTFPNLWHYRYHYPRLRALKLQGGEVLPEQPRSPYELKMHINEQNPRTLRTQLGGYFPYVRLWFANTDDMPGNLVKPYGIRALAAARDVFVVASKRPIDTAQLRTRFQSLPLRSVWLPHIRIKDVEVPRDINSNQTLEITVDVDNRSAIPLNGYPPNPISLSYRWLDAFGKVVEENGVRTPIFPTLAPGSRRTFAVRVTAPRLSGEHTLRLTLVQEWVLWFDQPDVTVFCDVTIRVREQPL